MSVSGLLAAKQVSACMLMLDTWAGTVVCSRRGVLGGSTVLVSGVASGVWWAFDQVHADEWVRPLPLNRSALTGVAGVIAAASDCLFHLVP